MTTRRRQGELVLGAFHVLLEHGEPLPAKEVLSRLECRVSLTDKEREDYPSSPGTRRFEKAVRFATIPFTKAGWLRKDRGDWSITPEGETALLLHTDPAEFARAALREYRAWDEARQVGVEETTKARQRWRKHRLPLSLWRKQRRRPRVTSPTTSRRSAPTSSRICAVICWRPWDTTSVFTAPPGADHGIDLVAHNDPLGTSTPRIKVQVKRRRDSVGVEEMRAFMALLGTNDVGIYISLGGFSGPAAVLVRSQENRMVTMVDRKMLLSLWEENILRIFDAGRTLLPLRPVYYLDLET